ncbi:MAG TPA: GIY-YIG nuclease family protein, partial [Labilithrix sp.]|nr:GIY-YIG nuclease family protein [Labilithrix sp.]
MSSRAHGSPAIIPLVSSPPMPLALTELPVLVVDCQATGATPAHGDLLELGWSVTTGTGIVIDARAEWTKTARPVSRIVRKLTGWNESVPSIDAAEAWSRLLDDAPAGPRIPTVIHFAQFERRFLEHLHGADAFPLDVICLHEIAARLFPNLPRRNLRALAGTLGGTPDVLRRAGPHAAATAFVWRALVPRLAALAVTTWAELATWLDVPTARPRKSARQFPLSPAKRKVVPDAPGVYRFMRPNGDVLYVGKAASLKKRIASHYTTNAGARATERALEMLSQAHEVDVTTTETTLEAALLEVDEIQRLDPPYNVQLRTADRSAWFAAPDWDDLVPAVDDRHTLGPLPSRKAIAGIAAMRAMLLDGVVTSSRAAAAVGVGEAFAPPLDLFLPEWDAFRASELVGRVPRCILEASGRIQVRKSREDETGPAAWDRARIRR